MGKTFFFSNQSYIHDQYFRLTVGWVGVLSFITSFSFPYLLSSRWAGQGAFWMYSIISFVGFLFIAIFVPETRGKTEDQIKVYFQGKKEKAPKV